MFENIINFFIWFVILPVAWYAVQYGILELAKLGIFWDIVPEGFARAYVRMGQLSKIALSYSGFEFGNEIDGPDETTDNLGIYKVVHQPNAQAVAPSRLLDILLPARGVVWKGIPGFQEVYVIKKMTWTDDSFQERTAENLTEILVRSYSYGLTMNNVELEGNLEFNFKFLVVLQVTNPALALFRINRYVDAVLKGINLLVIRNFKQLSWTDVVGKTKKNNSQVNGATIGLLEQALDMIRHEASEFEKNWGVKVLEIGVYDFEAANDAARIAVTSEEVALLKAKAEVAEAEGQAKITQLKAEADAKAIKTRAQAEADAILVTNKAAKKMSPNALRLAELDTIRNAGANVTLIGHDLSIPAVMPINPSKGGNS